MIRSIFTLLLITLITTSDMNAQTVFDFTSETSLEQWYRLDDGVMGGISRGNLTVNSEGHGVFSGTISLANNGGFSSIRLVPQPIAIGKATKMHIRLKGDGKNYQFRIKNNRGQYFSYIYPFETSGDWQTIEISLNEMYPTFRGRKLNQPNFSGDRIEEIAFLIGNKKEEGFELWIDSLELN